MKLDPSLNPQQLEAVRTLDGPLLVLAGAGTGKTRVITCRIAQLIHEGTAPENILAVTFTNKAAREMRERVAGLLDPIVARKVTIGTFHAFCARLLRRHIQRLGYSQRFAISSSSYQLGLIRSLMSELGYSGEGHDPQAVQARISLAKNALLTPADLGESATLPQERETAAVYALYETRMRNMDMLDFDDLLVLVLRLWTRFPEVLKEHQQQYRYLLVDEYQDTNIVQFRLVASLAGKSANLCVVGDDDQSIYGWRGATLDNILHFDEHFPKAKVIRLEQNYRSTEIILEAANSIIRQNPNRHKKRLWSRLGRGGKLYAVRTHDEEEEAGTVANLVRELHQTEGRPYADFAVLYRSNHQSRLFEEKFREARLPYTIVGSHSFYERKEILDAISLLQSVWNPKDDLALLRILNVPPRGLGDKSIERLRDLKRITSLPLQQLLIDDLFLEELPGASSGNVRRFADCLQRHRAAFLQSGGLAGRIEAFLHECGYLDGLAKMYKPREDALNRLENLHEFINAAADLENRLGADVSLGDFLERFALMDDNDRREKGSGDEDGVVLTTVHAAKGLEFPVVIIVGMEHGLFPHQQAVEEQRLDEERRLFYVAVTRARQALYLTHSEQRKVRGTPQRRRPSAFLEELPAELLEERTADNLFTPATQEAAAGFLARMKAEFKAKSKPATERRP